MKRIEFDTTNGVNEVANFDTDTVKINGKFVFDYLKEDFEGTRGAEVDMKTFRQIDAEYGIKKSHVTSSEMGKKGGSSKTPAKIKASAENGKKGGRPKKAKGQD